MNMKFGVLCYSLLLTSAVCAAEPVDAYPVLCWTYYSFTNRLDDARTVADWKALGINRPLSPRVDGRTDKAAFRAFLDRCLATGIRPYVYDTRIAGVGNIRTLIRERNDGGAAYRALVREVVADWGDHPAVSGLYVGDEPDAPDASATFLAARIQREEAPRLEPLLNLLPWFDWIGSRIGAKSLGEYLDRCRRESGLDFLGYDCYAQQKHGRAAKDIDDYFVNLREWAAFGKRSGVRWNTTLLCTSHYGYTIESEDDFRWQISTAAAMGAKGLSWFYPDMHMGPHDNYRNAPINALGERSETFGWLSTEMRLFQRQFGAALMSLNWQSACCAGRTYGGLPALESVTNGPVRAVSSRDGALVSFFKDAHGAPYVALVALARTVSDGLRVTFAPNVEPETLAWNGWEKLSTVFDPLDTEKRGPHTVFLHAAPGQLFLVRLKTHGVVNPLVRQNAPDPFTAYDAASGWYYHLHTENPTDGSGGFSSDRVVLHRARHAGELLWADESRVVYQANAVDGVGGFLWAPEMHRAPNGKWYIYTSCARSPEGGVKRLIVLEAKTDDPFDGFRLKAFPDETIFAIDPTVFTAKDGRQYMCYSQVKPEKGQVLQIREMTSPWSFGARQAELAFAELPWECVPPYDKSKILEGAFFVTSPRDGGVSIVYSANGCWSQGYCLGVLDHLGGDLCEAKNWKKRAAPVFASGNGVYGPGHAAFFRSPDEKELWVSYHFLADENPSNGPTDRLFALQRFNVDEATGGPAVTVPVRLGVLQPEPSNSARWK